MASPEFRNTGNQPNANKLDQWNPGGYFSSVRRECLCSLPVGKDQCISRPEDMKKLRAEHPNYVLSTCTCWADRRVDRLLYCYPEDSWTLHTCTDCLIGGKCEKTLVSSYDGTGEGKCLCHAKVPNYCVLASDAITITQPPTTTTTTSTPSTTSSTTSTSTTPTTTTTSAATTTTTTVPVTTTTTTIPTTTTPEVEESVKEALGFEGLTDEVAIATKGKENIVFAVAALEPELRASISYTKEELILKCSFNGKQDFIRHVDPVFGNCYTFNHNRSVNLSTTRAGATYGLRVLMYSNMSDYLPTTEEAGVRIAIHEKSQVPFPDTLGYSAPTGLLSSFGMRLRRFERLPEPYGHCLSTAGEEAGYIYTGFSYSVEGCHRSCFQRRLVASCGCADPRFPAGSVHSCPATDPIRRKCLENTTDWLNENSELEKEDVYDVSFSASQWPSGVAQVAECRETDKACIRRYKRNAAMVQIYYEQLNYESLSESEAYGFENLLADVGGQLGLWMGVSIISFMELLALLYNLVLARRRQRLQKNRPFSPDAMHSMRCACNCNDGSKCGGRKGFLPLLKTRPQPRCPNSASGEPLILSRTSPTGPGGFYPNSNATEHY